MESSSEGEAGRAASGRLSLHLLYCTMVTVLTARHRQVVEDLADWWSDICKAGIGSRIVLVEVPRGWGATTVLREFGDMVVNPDAPVTISISVDEVPLVDRAIEASALREALLTPFVRSRLAHLLGLDTPAGKTELALSVGGLFVSGMAVQLSLLMTSLGVTAAGNAWDDSPAGQQGGVARAARAVAALSTDVPVTVLIDDADHLDPGLAATMIDNLASRYDGQVLVVAVVNQSSALAQTLRAPDRYSLLGRVVTAEADPDMSAPARAGLTRELCPSLPDWVIERIGRRTASFAEVFAVAREERLDDISAASDSSSLAIVDAVIDATVTRANVSTEGKVLAWAGGALTERQADKALEALGACREQREDPEVIRAEGLSRLRDPASSRVREQAERLAVATRRMLAAGILEEAFRSTSDSDSTPMERTVARLAAHRVRADLSPSAELTDVQCLLIRDLEQLADPAAAYEVASAALAELPGSAHAEPQRMELMKPWLRLAHTVTQPTGDPLIQEAIELATASGALLGPEARVWAAVNLLQRPGEHAAALTLVDQITADLGKYSEQDPTVNQWRMLLAFHTGRAGYPGAAHRLLDPILRGGPTEQQDAAQAILRALDSSRADIWLQITVLEAELQAALVTTDDEFYRLHHTLAMNYDRIGNNSKALGHAKEALSFGLRCNGPDHVDVLRTRNDIASWTGSSGDAKTALRLFKELLPDLVRVLGYDHHGALGVRANIARWTGECGDVRGSLRLFQKVLPDLVRILGNDHRDVLTVRSDIASLTWKCGDVKGALRLTRKVLPDLVRVLGNDHPDVLTARLDIAHWTGECGDIEGALRLAREVLPDRVRVLGAEHPSVLTNRNDIAYWTGECGDKAGALKLFKELLPDQIRILGKDHPNVLDTRENIATFTADCGDTQSALRLSRELLSDKVRVLGRNHPDVLLNRSNIAYLTGMCGDAKGASRLFQELLPDQIRVLGRNHPDVHTTRNNIVFWGLESTGTRQARAKKRR